MDGIGFEKYSQLYTPWSLGDLVWTKLSSFPWWPSMIINDPISNLFTRIKKNTREYHVQFFGENNRAWVFEKNIISLEKPIPYKSLLALTNSNAKNCKEANITAMEECDVDSDIFTAGMSNKFKTVWAMGVAIAEQAIPYDNQSRIAAFGIDYIPPDENSPKKIKPIKKLKTPRTNLKLAAQDKDSLSNDQFNDEVKELQVKSTPKSKPKKSNFKIKLLLKEKNPEIKNPNDGKLSPVRTKRKDHSFTEIPVKKIKRRTVELKDTVKTKSSGIIQQNVDSLVDLHSPHYITGEIKTENISPLDKNNKNDDGDDLNREGSQELFSPPTPSDNTEEKNVSEPIETTEIVTEEILKTEVDEAFETVFCNGSDDTLSNLSTEIKNEPECMSFPLDNQDTLSNKSSNISSSGRSSRTKVLNGVTVHPPHLNKNDTPNSKPNRKSIIDLNAIDIGLPAWSKTEKGMVQKFYFCGLCMLIEPNKYFPKTFDSDGYIKCSNVECSNIYHKTCILDDMQEKCETTDVYDTHFDDNFKCQECIAESGACFICKAHDGDLEPCMLPSCGKNYHKNCVSRYPLTVVDTKGFVCPRHQCANCISEYPKNPKATKGKLVTCLLCPSTYHRPPSRESEAENCVAAGSFVLSDRTIICGDHNQPPNHLNVGWCFICSSTNGPDLVCCDSCPAAFHKSCVPGLDIPDMLDNENIWWCPDCESGRRPVIGDIVWAKLSAYRWWPACVASCDNIPVRVKAKVPGSCLSDLPGRFPVFFFGSHDYYWIHRTRVFLFADGDTATAANSSKAHGKSLNQTFAKALQEASAKYEERKKHKEDIFKENQAKMASRKYRPFKLIKCNKVVVSSSIHNNANHIKSEMNGDETLNDETASIGSETSSNHSIGGVNTNNTSSTTNGIIVTKDLHACNCDPNQDLPCIDDSTCLNRMSFIECHPKVCRAGERCHNQRFLKRNYPHTQPFATRDRGWGLLSLVDIKKGDFVYEYVGEIIDEAEFRKRLDWAHKNKVDDFYFLTLDKDRIIDAGPKGNLSRFMNHSCDPNLETQKWTVNGDIRVGLFAIKNIKAGEELCFNYNLECLGNERRECHCGAANCSGFLGVKPIKKSMDVTSATPKSSKKNKNTSISNIKTLSGKKPKLDSLNGKHKKNKQT